MRTENRSKHIASTMAMAKYEASQFVTAREVRRAHKELSGQRSNLQVYVIETCTGFEIRFGKQRKGIRASDAGCFTPNCDLNEFAEAVDCAARELDADVRRAA